MNIHKSYIGQKKNYPNLFVALGNFDGVHQGHRLLLSRLVKTARQQKAIPAVFTFDPHPTQIIKPDSTPPLLLSKHDKQVMIADLGVEVLFCIPFTKDFARMSPDSFISDLLVAELGIKGLWVGYNYGFGHGGKGNPEMLAQYAKSYDYRLEVLPPVIIDGQSVSSTMIRGLILDGNVNEAAKFLGYRPFIKGTVVNGERRGRQIGFPTANLDLSGKLVVPDTGVYAVWVKISKKAYQGVANIGYKPTFHTDELVKNLEVHIFDFQADIYGQSIEVEFVTRIRPEKRFASADELIKQIEKDKVAAIKSLDVNMTKPPEI